MRAQQLEEFLCALPDIAEKNIYVWGHGDTAANLHQEGFASEASLNICGYTVSKAMNLVIILAGGEDKTTERNCLLLKK